MHSNSDGLNFTNFGELPFSFEKNGEKRMYGKSRPDSARKESTYQVNSADLSILKGCELITFNKSRPSRCLFSHLRDGNVARALDFRTF